MKYRTVDGSEIARNIRKARADEAAMEASLAEIEADRQQALLDAEMPGITAEMIEALRTKAAEFNAAATRKTKRAAKFNADEARAALRKQLTEWLTKVETDHASNTTLLADAQEDQDERATADHEFQVKVLDISRIVITEALDKLGDAPKLRAVTPTHQRGR